MSGERYRLIRASSFLNLRKTHEGILDMTLGAEGRGALLKYRGERSDLHNDEYSVYHLHHDEQSILLAPIR